MFKHVYNPLLNVILSIHVVVVEQTVLFIFLHVDVNVVQVFFIQHRHVLVLNNVQMRVLSNLVIPVHRRIQLDVVMEHFVQNKIVF